jgi:peroxiredoxin
MTIEVNTIAPDFRLKDQNENEITLSSFKGSRVLLSFHPLAWTGVCAKQMRSLEANYDRFSSLDTIPLGVSIDTLPTKAAWAKELGIEKLNLLSDFNPLGDVAKSYGIFRTKDGFSERANIIIDGNGKVIFVKVYDLPELPDLEEIFKVLEAH